jgi:hypothetical protein
MATPDIKILAKNSQGKLHYSWLIKQLLFCVDLIQVLTNGNWVMIKEVVLILLKAGCKLFRYININTTNATSVTSGGALTAGGISVAQNILF